MSSMLEFLDASGYTAVSYPRDLQGAVNRLGSIWQAFVASPPSLKGQITYVGGAGYEHKPGGGITVDRKENFDFKRREADRMLYLAQMQTGPNAATLLIERAEKLFGYMSPAVERFARQLEEDLSLDGFVEEVMASEHSWKLRMLYYPAGAKEGDVVAAPHADKSGFTFHLYESAPGLQYLDWEGCWKDVSFGDSQTIIFPGFSMQLRSHNRVKALCHRVVVRPEALGGRFSVVCFVDLTRTPQYNKASAGPSNSQEPGFNYTIGLEEFSRLFAPYNV